MTDAQPPSQSPSNAAPQGTQPPAPPSPDGQVPPIPRKTGPLELVLWGLFSVALAGVAALVVFRLESVRLWYYEYKFSRASDVAVKSYWVRQMAGLSGEGQSGPGTEAALRHCREQIAATDDYDVQDIWMRTLGLLPDRGATDALRELANGPDDLTAVQAGLSLMTGRCPDAAEVWNELQAGWSEKRRRMLTAQLLQKVGMGGGAGAGSGTGAAGPLPPGVRLPPSAAPKPEK
jgi:hypothetical protein